MLLMTGFELQTVLKVTTLPITPQQLPGITNYNPTN